MGFGAILLSMGSYGIIFIYLEAVNLAAFALMGIDKRRARKKRRRIPESVLILSAVIGGGIGALAGMYLFRHKTRKKSFTVGIPVIMAMQAAFFLLLFYVISH